MIVAVGDGALNYTLRLQSESWTQTPVVFTMVDTGAASGVRRFADAATRPIIVTTESQIGAGGTGGFVVVSSALGQHAASLVMRIFEGESVSTIPITEGNAVRPVFDWRQLDRWNVGRIAIAPQQRYPLSSAERLGSVSLAHRCYCGGCPCSIHVDPLVAVRAAAPPAVGGSRAQHSVRACAHESRGNGQ